MNKKIYAAFGIILFLSISMVAFISAAGYANGTLLKSPKHTSVYYMENNTRRPFVNSLVYYTWFTNFNDVQTITVEQMESIELGYPMPIKEGIKMLKFPLNPKVYVIVENETIRHIPDEETAAFMYGEDWNKKIIELPEIYYLFYTKGSALSSKKSEYSAQQQKAQTEAAKTSTTNTKVSGVQTVVPNDDFSGCNYAGTCVSSQTCLKNQCVDAVQFLPSNAKTSETYCGKDQVYIDGGCQKATMNLVFHYQNVNKQDFEKMVDNAIASFVVSAELGECKDRIRVHKLDNFCLEPGKDIIAYLKNIYNTEDVFLIRPANEGNESCSYTNSGFISFGNYVDNGSGALVHEMGHVAGLFDQYCYYPKNSVPNPADFAEASCVPAEGWYVDYCSTLPNGVVGGYSEGQQITPYQCNGNKNKYGASTIMGNGIDGEVISAPKFHFTDVEIQYIKKSLDCA